MLTGYVPSLEDHETLKTIAASLFGSNVTDHVRVAAGEPRMDWIGAIKFAIGQLANLGNGKVTLGENSYSIEGEAATPGDLRRYPRDQRPYAACEPRGRQGRCGAADVRRPTASPWRAARRRSRSTAMRRSEKDKQAILDAAHKKFGSLEIVDKLGFASGAAGELRRRRDRSPSARWRALPAAAPRSSITSSPSKAAPTIRSAAEEIASTAADGLPEGFAGATSITLLQTGQPVPPERCRDLLQNELQKGTHRIQRQQGRASPTTVFGLLDRVAAIFARCPEVKVEVGAHSDSDGSSSKNRDLTQARAEAIVDYLVDAGVERERLKAVGYGEDKPVAENTTKAGKAANRRIEFTVAASGRRLRCCI